ncbi:MAG TPA: hypothetical protein DEF00_02450 [Candidatus Taylorbacteria bacterium]|nr:MAG: hypothetical protein UY03_C0028G0002 [Parcubacteria group bacterium GW2011_GWA2_47_64]KKU96284.1 MAG: hypothetical protein UY29_C0014G0020 [Parcubacteria group bacterium GW2011_GWC2_48_17]HBV01237.1 hypothetical protein [Candidatus Taylorbacteria bacterium]
MNYFRFTIVWVLLFAVLLVGFSSFGLVPKSVAKMTGTVWASLAFAESAAETVAEVSSTAPTIATAEETGTGTVTNTLKGMRPERIVIDKIGVSSPIVHPETTDVRVLDEELKKGVVQYPGSGYLNENSNVFLFGHSTGLPNVRNKAYEAFNDLNKLNIGDVIKIYAEDGVYEYSVMNISLTDANQALVTFGSDKKMLTLSTCNTFGKKEDRFVVSAELIRRVALVPNP